MHITIHSKGEQQGPFPAEQVMQLLQSGLISLTDLGWSPGMAEWKPLSAFPELQRNHLPPPVPGSAASTQVVKKNEPLSIWALVLGIISLVGCSVGGFIAGIPAVICGHVGLGRIKRNPSLGGRGMAIAGLITGYLGILMFPISLALALPAFSGALERGKATQMLNNMRQIFLAVQTAQLDAMATGNTNTGFPASAKTTSKDEFKKMLVSGKYLTAEDLEHMKFDKISVANVSDDDPGDTIFLKATSGRYVVIFRKGGDGTIYRPGQNTFSPDPPRNPTFLD